MDKSAFTVSVSVIAILAVLVLFGLYKLWKRHQTRQMPLTMNVQYTSPDNVEMAIMNEDRKEVIV